MGIWHAWGREQLHIGFWWGNLRVREHCVIPLGADGIIIDLQQVEWVDRDCGNLTLGKGAGGGIW